MKNHDYQHIKFSKYHGAGNDFIIINGYVENIILDKEQIIEMCDRRTGIGADGLIVLSPSENYDFKMIYFNSDGSGDTFCGNGGRCVTAFAYQEKIVGKIADYEASDGIHHAEIIENVGNEFIISLSMKDVLTYDLNDHRLIVNTGSPHHVTRVQNVDNYDVKNEGFRIRNDKTISENGVNADFMEYDGNNYVIRTYERGVEDETLACGTGVTASAIAASLWYGGNDIVIKTRIAKFKVSFHNDGDSFKSIILSGPATHVFDGFYIFANKK